MSKEKKGKSYAIYLLVAIIAVILIIIYFLFVDRCGDKVCSKNENYTSCSADCPNCDDNKVCTSDSFDLDKKACVNNPITPCCGNGICEKDSEDYNSCEIDCANCDDNDTCTKDTFNFDTQLCEHEISIPCCGNNVCESNEDLFSCENDCKNIPVLTKDVVSQLKIHEKYQSDNRQINVIDIDGNSATFQVIYINESQINRVPEGKKVDMFNVKIEIIDIYFKRDSNESYAKVKVT